MLHWAISFGVIALIAAAFALSGAPLVVLYVAQLLFWLNTVLFVLALLTGLFGRGRDGLYSAERACALAGGAAALVALGIVWIKNDWSAEDAGRALGGGVAELTRGISGGDLF